MGLKIISGFIMPVSVHRRDGQARLNLETGMFQSSSQFTVSDHRVSGTGHFIRPPHVTLALRRISMFVGDLSNAENDINYDLGDDFEQVVGGVPRRLLINWSVKHRFRDWNNKVQVMQKIREDQIAEISYLVIGETPSRPSLVFDSPLVTRVKRKKRAAKKA